MKSVEVYLCKLSSLSFLIRIILSSGTDRRASKSNLAIFSILSLLPITINIQIIYIMQNRRQLYSFAISIELLYSWKGNLKEFDTRDLNITYNKNRPQEIAIEEFVSELNSRYRYNIMMKKK